MRLVIAVAFLAALCLVQAQDEQHFVSNPVEPDFSDFERPFKEFASESNATSLEPLIKWLDSENVTVVAVKAVDFGDERGIGLVAQHNITAGLLYIIMPTRLVLLGQAIRQSGLADLISPQMSEREALVLMMAYSRTNASAPWHAAASSLPETFGQPMFWDRDLINEFQASGAGIIAKSSQVQLYTAYERLPEELRERVSFEDYRWAYGAVMSHSTKLYFKTREDREVPRMAMVPLLNLMKYANDSEANTQCGVLSGQPYLACNSTRNITAGEPITTYLDWDSSVAGAHVLLQRGVLVGDAAERNPADRLPVGLPFINITEEDPTMAIKNAVWNNTRATPLLAWTPPATEKDRSALPGHLDFMMAYVRLYLLPEDALKHATPKQVYDIIRANAPYSLSHERESVGLVVEYLSNYLAAYTTTIEEDREILAQAPNCTFGDAACFRTHVDYLHAVRVRLSEKEILQSNIDRMQAYIAALEEQNPSDEHLAAHRARVLAALPDDNPHFDFAPQMASAASSAPQKRTKEFTRKKIEVRTEL